MSYGFYRMPPHSTHEDFIVKASTRMGVCVAVAVETVEHTTELKPVQPDTITTDNTYEPPKTSETLVGSEVARAQGFSGNMCTNCNGFRLKWAGHCQVCEDCGTTTGCS
jgi:molybdenum cofactor biosynthesis enzyme MoaA